MAVQMACVTPVFLVPAPGSDTWIHARTIAVDVLRLDPPIAGVKSSEARSACHVPGKPPLPGSDTGSYVGEMCQRASVSAQARRLRAAPHSSDPEDLDVSRAGSDLDLQRTRR